MRIAIELDVVVKGVTVDEKPVAVGGVIERTAGQDPSGATDAGPAAGLAVEMTAPAGEQPPRPIPASLQDALESETDAGSPVVLPHSGVPAPTTVGSTTAAGPAPSLSHQDRFGAVFGNGAGG